MVQTPAYTLIIAYNIEAIFLGMNCVLYAFCVYTLWGQKSISCRLLLLINTVQILLCVVQAILHTVFLFLLLTVVSDIQLYLQHVNAYLVGSTVIFGINFITAGFVSIWRLYVLYDNAIKVCIPAFIIWIAQVCATAIALRICATTPVTSTTFSALGMLLWALITSLNLCVTILICLRLFVVQKRTHTISNSSPYRSIAIALAECGALITACSVAMLVLYACNYAYALVNLGTATEIAIASQLLITARHGMLRRGRNDFNSASTALGVGTTPTEPIPASPPEPVNAKIVYSWEEPQLQDKKGWQPSDAT